MPQHSDVVADEHLREVRVPSLNLALLTIHSLSFMVFAATVVANVSNFVFLAGAQRHILILKPERDLI